MIVILVVTAVLLVTLSSLAWCIRRAPRGWEDDTGFHLETPHDDPDYQAWVEELAKECACSGDRPCDGLMAGGLCDNLQLHGEGEA